MVRLRSVQTGPASLAPKRVPKLGRSDCVTRVAPRLSEVKQQQETCRITDCLDELMGENVGFDRDLLSMSTSAAACLPGNSREVRLRKAQTGPELEMASLVQRVADEEVSSDSECSLCPGDDLKCRCFHEEMQARNRRRELRRDDLTATVMPRSITNRPPAPHYQHCALVAGAELSNRANNATTARKLLRAVAGHTRLLIAPRSSRHFACGDHKHVIPVQACLEVLALRLSCEGSSGRDRHRDRQRQTERCRDRQRQAETDRDSRDRQRESTTVYRMATSCSGSWAMAAVCEHRKL